jgi:site-specific recombinase XerC
MKNQSPLQDQLISIYSRNREDSHATQRKRSWCLGAAARALTEKFGLQKLENLKHKHVQFLVELWKETDTRRRSIEEKLTYLRWMLHKIGKQNLLPKTNRELGIEPGPRHTRACKIVTDERLAEILAAIPDPRIQSAVLLARHVELRFKEAMLFRPGRDCDGERVWIKRGSKGGRPRYLYVHNANQKEFLEGARRLASKDGALIPKECSTYETWRQHVYPILRAAGVGRHTDTPFHNLRRTYVVERMDDLINNQGLNPDRAATLVAREVGQPDGGLEVVLWKRTGLGHALARSHDRPVHRWRTVTDAAGK